MSDAPARVSRHVGAISPSATLAVDAKAKALRAAGEPVIGFGAGEPDFSTPAHIVDAAVEACRVPRFHKYTPAPGLPELREAVAVKTARDSGYEVEPSQVVITNGGKHAVYNTMQVVLDAGDEVLLPAPFWTTYPEPVGLAGATCTVLPTTAASGFRVTVDQLETARTDRTKALIFVSPSNPSGAVYPAEEMRAIGEWAAEHGIWVITDEIYEHLTYGSATHHSIVTLVPELADRCVVVNGVAKTYAMTGWRVGWIIAPADVAKAAGTLQSHQTSNVANVSQIAALAAVSGPLDAVEEMRAAFDRRRVRIHSLLNAIDGVSCLDPEGAFYAFPSLSGLLGRDIAGATADTTVALADLLLEQAKVAFVPGEAFGTPGYGRFSFALSDADLEEGIRRVGDLAGWVGGDTPRDLGFPGRPRAPVRVLALTHRARRRWWTVSPRRMAWWWTAPMSGGRRPGPPREAGPRSCGGGATATVRPRRSPLPTPTCEAASTSTAVGRGGPKTASSSTRSSPISASAASIRAGRRWSSHPSRTDPVRSATPTAGSRPTATGSCASGKPMAPRASPPTRSWPWPPTAPRRCWCWCRGPTSTPRPVSRPTAPCWHGSSGTTPTCRGMPVSCGSENCAPVASRSSPAGRWPGGRPSRWVNRSGTPTVRCTSPRTGADGPTSTAATPVETWSSRLVASSRSAGPTGSSAGPATRSTPMAGWWPRCDVPTGDVLFDTTNDRTDHGWATISAVRTDADGRPVLLAASHDQLVAVVRPGDPPELVSVPHVHGVAPGYLPPPELIDFPTTDDETAHALFYRPAHPSLAGPEDERPPLLVLAHGGPSSQARRELQLGLRYWTSRGWAVVDVDYRGSTGYGRSYLRALEGRWGLADVDDCIAAARHLAQRGDVDPERLAIRGGSAGGFTVISALTFHDVFTAGASRYGIADLEVLATDTHKFESRYLEGLVGPYPTDRATYVARSPIHHTERLSAPMIVLQGADDEVVPPNQAEMMVEALAAKGVEHRYVLFEREGHGFRRSENIVAALEAEETFFAHVFGFTPP